MHPNVGYEMAQLSKFNQNPAKFHYISVKHDFRYLRQTKDWGLIYWRSVPREDLPHIDFQQRVLEDKDMKLMEPAASMQLATYVDAEHSTNLTNRRFICGMVATLNGTAIAYKAKWQPTVATSTNESGFIAAVSAGKMCKFIRHILDEFGFPQHEPTAIYEDNAADILMANSGKPTKRS